MRMSVRGNIQNQREFFLGEDESVIDEIEEKRKREKICYTYCNTWVREK
jgi:hypothetical protein